MIDRSDAESAIYRTAVAAFSYYADKHIDEPGYTIDEDLDWCTQPLRGLPEEVQRRLRDEIRALITDPARDRQPFIRDVIDLSDA
ncbi:hypothetical protein [Microbacterium sulfonylureivorans]|uniref:hypothetical protein n=1 Tax=Microbacterium sulfonylureivorans TaxID=2486854 RepID=UPI000FDA5652|nr:hypothetical protein [Microbacterium sulfonylureivorans]